ncbi:MULTISPECIES: DUF7130 family rubredoxin-like protein [Halorussus]|uniref:DUF7130 family rubredoxin-like protein n=1 Tax=Halorussus TaxID=1070314 RepID=UPI00209D6EA1|nr:hypothetical protein [Halorussus vallis]USZ74920.1 hypothetical protein NGM07_15950 [Halorussus vallis]
MTEDSAAVDSATAIETGTVVYDPEGNELGVIAGMTDEGFEVATTEDIEHVDEDGRAEVGSPDVESEQAAETNEESLRNSEQEHDPGQQFGEGYIMWRCDECGEMGELDDGLPEECPNCGDENVYKWRED